jgi:glycogen(starch) synthase
LRLQPVLQAIRRVSRTHIGMSTAGSGTPIRMSLTCIISTSTDDSGSKPRSQDCRSQIHFTGWLTPQQMAAHYRAADILVVPSWYEPFGMVVLEGMIHGLAVAAAAVGAPAEILRDGQTGLLFAPCDAQALAQAILRLTQDPDFRLRIAESGAREVRENWLWPSIVQKMQRVYDEAIAGRRGRKP